MSFLLLDILQDGLAHRPDWIACVEDVKNNVRRVDDLVKLAIDTPRRSFRVDRLDVVGVSLFFDGSGDLKERQRELCQEFGWGGLPGTEISPSAAVSASCEAAPTLLNSSKSPTSNRGRFR